MFDEALPDAPPIDFLSLPGFAEAKAHLEETGHPSAWLTEVVDTSDRYTIFLKNGRPWYKASVLITRDSG